MSEKLLDLRNITLSYEDDIILDNVNLYVKDNEFVTLLGPSGCGKTTTLRIIAGFIKPDKGDVYFEGKKINDVPPHKRKVNTVFQRYALFPHLNVFDNVAFGLKVNKVPQDEIKARVKKMLEIVDLKGFEKRRVTKLSGGQQQRVAIARALVNQPKVLLLDEPLGALDLKLRKEMQVELKRIQQQMNITFVYVTHDQEEALSMSDTIVVMKGGVIQQIGTPEDIYNEPKNAFVADFIGESNIFDGKMIRDYLVQFSGIEFECVDKGFKPNQPIDVVIRPEDITIVSPEKSELKGVVTNCIFKGVHYEITVKCNGLDWMIHSTKAPKVDDIVGLSFGPEDIHIMNKLFKGDKNIFIGKVTDEDTITFLDDITFTRKGLNLPIDTTVELIVDPADIAVVSEDISDITGFLESLIYKGAHNELIVYTRDTDIMIHSQNDEQVATNIGLKFNFDKIEITPVIVNEEV
jgi:spermidine/putrescine transport system ATP-binding protein